MAGVKGKNDSLSGFLVKICLLSALWSQLLQIYRPLYDSYGLRKTISSDAIVASSAPNRSQTKIPETSKLAEWPARNAVHLRKCTARKRTLASAL